MIHLSNERLSFRILVIALALSVAACGQVNPSASGNAAAQAANGTAALNWSPVTQNTDGSELTDLAGYLVFYGTSPGAMSTLVTLSDPNQTSYVVANLSAGTWYFSVAAYTSSGIQGEMSNVVSKSINAASE
jgi:fibronectin type III domain protein